MATWVTHLMIADGVMNEYPSLHRGGFCVGNIAPDCNVENEDWTAFTPSREVTHWMTGERKKISDCNGFYEKYLTNQRSQNPSEEGFAFLLGYYAHLLTDAAFQKFIRDEERVKSVWKRIKADSDLQERSKGYVENFDSVKLLISREERTEQIYTFEAEYLQKHQNSGYLTEILPLKYFPDYIDYMPHGCITRKIKIMGYMPQITTDNKGLVAMTREEYKHFVKNTIKFVMETFEAYKLV